MSVTPTHRKLIQKRYRQIDRSLLKCIKYLAQMRCTVDPVHSKYLYDLFQTLVTIELLRKHLLTLYRAYCGGSERDMWKPHEIIETLERASPIPPSIR